MRIEGTTITSRPLLRRNWSRGGAGPAPVAGRTLSAALPKVSVESLSGEPVNLPTLARGTLVVNFWATWCTACARDDDLLAVASDPGFADVAFVALSLDDPRTSQPDTAALAAWGARFVHGRTDPAGQAPLSAAAGLPAGAVPLTVVVRDGVVRWAHAGAVNAEDLAAALAATR